jgi:multiple antibiotic resistance protein
MTMIFGQSKPQAEIASLDHAQRVAVFPVAIPSIASPGAMLAVVVLTDNDRFSVAHQAMTTAAMAVVLAITFVFLVLAAPIHRVIGITGEMIISRIMGMILAAVAVDAILAALTTLGVIPSP